MEQAIFPIVEIFQSMQGEGFNTGKVVIFIRLGRCNLNCPWCDTDFDNFNNMNYEEIFMKIKNYSSKNIIITGGEPTIHNDLVFLVNSLKNEGYNVWIETNGLRQVPKGVSYIATSPKRIYKKMYEKNCIQQANEVRIVVDDYEVYDFCEFIEDKIEASKYYLSPCEINGEFNFNETIKILGELNSRGENKKEWLLSIQTHKIINIR